MFADTSSVLAEVAPIPTSFQQQLRLLSSSPTSTEWTFNNRRTPLAPDELCDLAGALATNTTVRAIGLKLNYLGDEGAVALAEALMVNQSLRSIDLTSNQIGPAGAAALAVALRFNTVLEVLDMHRVLCHHEKVGPVVGFFLRPIPRGVLQPSS
eukprot:TRINITY_DN3142_c0_g1_i1.p1 TRINITY_DN3142_c0_g1~~TRINITY_DN3142_c0_g1_i1.p1  ORF type:complete len:163 (+),score=25.93 TRINITY_DN3142_c0_g1_i1:28-489(+)